MAFAWMGTPSQQRELLSCTKCRARKVKVSPNQYTRRFLRIINLSLCSHHSHNVTEQGHAQLAVLVVCLESAASSWLKVPIVALSNNLTDLGCLKRRTSVSKNVYKRTSLSCLKMRTALQHSRRWIQPQSVEVLLEYP